MKKLLFITLFTAPLSGMLQQYTQVIPYNPEHQTHQGQVPFTALFTAPLSGMRRQYTQVAPAYNPGHQTNQGQSPFHYSPVALHYPQNPDATPYVPQICPQNYNNFVNYDQFVPDLSAPQQSTVPQHPAERRDEEAQQHSPERKSFSRRMLDCCKCSKKCAIASCCTVVVVAASLTTMCMLNAGLCNLDNPFNQ